jgi:hypothetical protein
LTTANAFISSVVFTFRIPENLMETYIILRN